MLCGRHSDYVVGWAIQQLALSLALLPVESLDIERRLVEPPHLGILFS